MRILAVVLSAVIFLFVVTFAIAGSPFPSTDERLANIEGTLGIVYEATEAPTFTATATNTAAPTNTAQPAPTSTATSTAVPTATAGPPANVWHARTDHEHGAAPPAWADAWMVANYGHPVQFGPEAERGYKGYSGNVTADDGSTVAVYALTHIMSFDGPRSKQFHFVDWFMKDATGAVTHMWWWGDFGDPATQRGGAGSSSQFLDVLRSLAGPDDTIRPANLIITKDNEYKSGFEYWYNQTNAGSGGWHPTFIVRIYNPLTFTDGTETGYYGTSRRLEFRWIAGGSTITNIQGQPYLNRNMADPRGWFCTDEYAVITATDVSGPGACQPDELAQYIAPTLPTIADTSNPPRIIYSPYAPTGGLTFPN